MTDIVEEARALLAQVKDDPYPFDCDEPLDDAKRLLAALADECERLRKQNSEYHRRAQVAEAAVLEETTRGHRLGRSVGRSLANAAASTAMRECERLRAENARLREAMPTDEEWAHMQEARAEDKLNAECPDHIASNRIIDRWLARLDAAKEGR